MASWPGRAAPRGTVTTNLGFGEWGNLFSNPGTATAVLDRFLHHAHVIVLKGDSYRMRSRLIPKGEAV